MMFTRRSFLADSAAGMAAAAAGLRSPTQFERRHAVYRDAFGRIYGADELFKEPAAHPSD